MQWQKEMFQSNLLLFICLCSPPLPFLPLLIADISLSTSNHSSPHLCPPLPPAQTINIMSRGWQCSFMEHCMFIRGRRSLREMLTVFINGPHPRLMRHGTSSPPAKREDRRGFQWRRRATDITATGKRLVIVSKLYGEEASQGLTVTEQLWQAKRAVSN